MHLNCGKMKVHNSPRTAILCLIVTGSPSNGFSFAIFASSIIVDCRKLSISRAS